jgi:lipopolysaccharide transport system ATP-binding protein
MEAQGTPSDVINRYIGLVLEKQQARQEKQQRFDASFRHGDGVSEILSVDLLNAAGAPVTSVTGGETVTVRIRSRFHHPACDPMVGILIRNRIGMDVYGTNTRIEKKHLGSYQPGDLLEVDFQFACWLTPQQYTLTVATQSPDGSSHDWLDDVIPFDVVDARAAAGVANLRAEIEWRASR